MSADPRVEAALAAYVNGWDLAENLRALFADVVEATDAADDHVRVPREVLQIMRERAAMDDLGTIRWRLNELLGDA